MLQLLLFGNVLVFLVGFSQQFLIHRDSICPSHVFADFDQVSANAIAEVHHHRWLKRRRRLVTAQPDKKLQAWRFRDQLHCFSIRQAQS